MKRKTMSLILCFIMLFSVSVAAVDSSDYSNVSAQYLSELGVNISTDAQIESVYSVDYTLNSGSSSKASSNLGSGKGLRIIEYVDDNNILVHDLLFLSKNQNGDYFIDSSRVDAITRDDPIGGAIDDLGPILVQATTSYTTHLIPTVAYTYRPTGLSWSYSGGANSDVSSIRIVYSTNGTAYNYSTHAVVQYNYLHQIISSVGAPLANQGYSNYNNPSPYSVDISLGAMKLDFYGTIDGRSYFASP